MTKLENISNKELLGELRRRVARQEAQQELADTVKRIKPYFNLMFNA